MSPLEGILEGLRRLLSGDPYLWEIIALTARTSGSAVFISAALGVPLGALLGLARFPGRRTVQAAVYTGMGLPPVVVGLFVYLLLSRQGWLAQHAWPGLPALFSAPAMVLAQVIIATPLITGYTLAAVEDVPHELQQQIRALGATPAHLAAIVVFEARRGILVAVLAGFGRVVSEVGAVMMVGGNIEHATRVLSTAILLETRQGHFDTALGLGVVLLLLAFLVNLTVSHWQRRALP